MWLQTTQNLNEFIQKNIWNHFILFRTLFCLNKWIDIFNKMNLTAQLIPHVEQLPKRKRYKCTTQALSFFGITTTLETFGGTFKCSLFNL